MRQQLAHETEAWAEWQHCGFVTLPPVAQPEACPPSSSPYFVKGRVAEKPRRSTPYRVTIRSAEDPENFSEGNNLMRS